MVVAYIIGWLIVIGGIIFFFLTQEENEDFYMTVSFIGLFILGLCRAFELLYHNRGLHPIIMIGGMLGGVSASFFGAMFVAWLANRLILGPLKSRFH